MAWHKLAAGLAACSFAIDTVFLYPFSFLTVTVTQRTAPCENGETGEPVYTCHNTQSSSFAKQSEPFLAIVSVFLDPYYLPLHDFVVASDESCRRPKARARAR
jgi:hypothetical protein